MAKTKATATLTGETVLYYTGGPDGHPFLSGIPARDLSDGDVARLAWEDGDRSGLPTDTPAEARAAVVERLLGSGLYLTTPPVTPAVTEGSSE